MAAYSFVRNFSPEFNRMISLYRTTRRNIYITLKSTADGVSGKSRRSIKFLFSLTFKNFYKTHVDNNFARHDTLLITRIIAL